MFAAERTGGYVDKWEYPELIHLVRESEAKFLTFKVTDCLDGSLQESFHPTSLPFLWYSELRM